MPVTNYIWDVENDSYLMETDESDVTTVVYTNEPDEFGDLVSQRRGANTSTYHYDGLGSTRELTDSIEDITDTFLFSAFGETVAKTGTTTNPFRYVGSMGYYYDEETEEYYIRARNYDPVNARWMSQDPMLFEDGPNLYVYVHNSPLNGTDPDGFGWFGGCKQGSVRVIRFKRACPGFKIKNQRCILTKKCRYGFLRNQWSNWLVCTICPPPPKKKAGCCAAPVKKPEWSDAAIAIWEAAKYIVTGSELTGPVGGTPDIAKSIIIRKFDRLCTACRLNPPKCDPNCDICDELERVKYLLK